MSDNSGSGSSGFASFLVQSDVKSAPAKVQLKDGSSLSIKIDILFRGHGLCAIGGWASAPAAISLAGGAEIVPALREEIFARADVNSYLKVPAKEKLCFGSVWKVKGDDPLYLNMEFQSQKIRLRIPLENMEASNSLHPSFSGALGRRVYKILNSEEERQGFSLNDISAMMDTFARFQDQDGEIIVMAGWLVMPPQAEIVVQAGDERIKPQVEFYWRPDINAKFGRTYANRPGNSGYFLSFRLPAAAAGQYEIFAEYGGIRHKLFEEGLDNPIPWMNFIKKIFTVPLPLSQFARVCQKQLLPLLESAQKQFMAADKNCRKEQGIIGNPAPNPSISVIVPIYGSLDLTETQFMCFSEDDIFEKEAEIIYVIDDPALLEPFLKNMNEWAEVYGLSCRWIASSQNLGYSAANNLGASLARGKYLAFLNSDVFPRQGGWLDAMRDYLLDHQNVGIVGCRLVDANGSIQHAGMTFYEWKALFTWVNVHPLAGCAPELDPASGPVSVPAVTGACMLTRKKDFDRLGGWREDYILGDFEDSDLCLRARAAGLDIVYMPNVCLVHLERQSFAEMEKGDFRQRLTLYNAALHQRRWRPQMEKLAKKWADWLKPAASE